MALRVKSWENRGTKKIPWGFVYFNDGNRVVFADGNVRPSNWAAVTNQHLRLAKEALTTEKVKGYNNDKN